ncbi:hypothetical protein [Sphingomonas colocasiae]|uniref:Uncharacterized protein n=1 Tax=Sphingomonas colocasiae TaxID=1848973 RepID=A0ABS7PYA4_9SPHN|nr:hypothetical protein [Sphingomonas colocasiae]MBY8826330.1 hypothetical protein [Sphingomonas colocasiae]
MTSQITGWKIEARERAALLAQFAPRYARTVADHVTLHFATGPETPLPEARTGEVVGVADDGQGVQALVVRIDGTTDRGDGSHFHITWSLAEGRAARESNDVIAVSGWRAVEPAIPVTLVPARWPR